LLLLKTVATEKEKKMSKNTKKIEKKFEKIEKNVEMKLDGKKVSVVVEESQNISSRKFDANLLESLKLNEQLTPVQVYKVKGKYYLLNGYRRVSALMELKKTPHAELVQSPKNDSDRLRLQFAHNQSESTRLNSLVKPIRDMVEDGESVTTISKSFGISPSSVSKALKVSSLPDTIQKNDKISFANKVLLAKSGTKVQKEINEKQLLNLNFEDLKKQIKTVKKSLLKPKKKGERVEYTLNQKRLIAFFKSISEPQKFGFSKTDILKNCFTAKIVKTEK
jgi:ParB/RepB/Spo0J family partition protein